MKVLVVVLAAHVAISAASLFRVATEHGILKLEGRQKRGTNAHIKGSFRSADGDGIRFHTTVQSLAVTTMDGQTLVKSSRFPVSVQSYGQDDKATVFQILDVVYAESNEQTYRLTAADIDTAAAQARGTPNPITRTQLFANLQARELSDPQTAIQASVERLLAHPSSRLLEPAARALGVDLGVTGMDEPAAMPFYTTAMKLTEARSRIERRRTSRNSFSSYLYRPAVIQKYPDCDLTTCPPCKEDECFGLCGYGCTCWIIVCGDCCLHKGCVEHDACCRKNGFFSAKYLFTFNLACAGYDDSCM